MEERSSGDSGDNTDPASSAQLRASISQVRKVRRQARKVAKQRRAEIKRARQQRQTYQGERGSGEVDDSQRKKRQQDADMVQIPLRNSST
ncbi:hypothetical protein DVH05_007346 [Phytophthora capsici]|nr:hypothetical protein DVH05_007346 [Phytophthora capsici]